jgi:uncharacterized Fe-S cluster-containing radical SAM superfamily protein
LPIDPALKALGRSVGDTVEAQVFQLAACNWRCWYCFVDYTLLGADARHGAWVTAPELVECLLQQQEHPSIIDLSGGQPDLVPEWVPWMMDALVERGMDKKTYLWSDDNLSNDYFWRYLSDCQMETICNYEMYGRVGCFKGFDATSFYFNTKADPRLCDRQFDLFERLLKLNIDLYGYVTLTTPEADSIGVGIPRFVDRLQQIHERLPLRVVPLLIRKFTPVIPRIGSVEEVALDNQWKAVSAWTHELETRFTSEELRETPSTVVLD